MRHNVYGRKLGRNKDERDLLFKSLIFNLFSYGSIETTLTRAKAVRGMVDKVINHAKSKTSQRLISSYLNDKSLQERLINEIAPKTGNRTSGFTSLIRIGRRSGDSTMIVKMSLIGSEEMKPIKKVTGDSLQGTVEETKKVISDKKGGSNRIEKSVKSIVKKRLENNYTLNPIP